MHNYADYNSITGNGNKLTSTSNTTIVGNDNTLDLSGKSICFAHNTLLRFALMR